MKRLLFIPIILISLFFTSLTTFASEKKNNLKETITFNKEVYHLKYSNTNQNTTTNEYIRKHESLQKWNKLLTVKYIGNTSVKLKKYINDTYNKEDDGYILLLMDCKDNLAYVSFMILGQNYLEYHYCKYIMMNKNITEIEYTTTFEFTPKTTIENLMKRVQAHHNQIVPTMNENLNIDVKFIDFEDN